MLLNDCLHLWLTIVITFDILSYFVESQADTSNLIQTNEYCWFYWQCNNKCMRRGVCEGPWIWGQRLCYYEEQVRPGSICVETSNDGIIPGTCSVDAQCVPFPC